MNRMNFWYVFAMLGIVLNIGCERNASNKSRISLELPQELQEQMKSSSVSSYSTIELRHLVLQITAPDIAPIQIIVDSHNDEVIPAVIEAEVATGDNRLVQVLAAYAAPDSDMAFIYYGDITKNFRSASEEVPVDIFKLGAAASAMSRVTGRYLTSSTSGPSGIINMIYRPSGKPEMPVDKKPMLGGWFEISVFEDIAMDYRLDSGLVLGTQWTSASFPASNQVVRIKTPTAFERIFGSGPASTGPVTYKPRDAGDDIIGYFSADPSFVSDKNVCVSGATDLNNGTWHSRRALISQDLTTAMPIKHFAYGTTPTYSATQVTLFGGKDRTNCGTLLESEEYQKYMWFKPHPYSQGIEQDYAQVMGLREGFVETTTTDQTNNATYRTEWQTGYTAALGPHYIAKVLPGMENGIDGVQLYENASGFSSWNDNRCDRMEKNSQWISRSLIQPTFSGSNVLIPFSNITSSSLWVACLTVKGKSFGRFLELKSTVPVPSTGISALFMEASAHPNECKPVSINLNASGIPYNQHGSISVTVEATYSSSPTTVLYSDSTCSGTPASQLTTNITAPRTSSILFFKAGTAGTYSVSIQSSTPALTIAGNGTLNVETEGSTVADFEMVPHFGSNSYPVESMDIYNYGCFPFKVTTKSATNSTATSNATFNLYLASMDGTTVTLPSGFGFYDTCADTTPISTLAFSSQSSKGFVIKTQGIAPKDRQLKISGLSMERFISLNPTPLAFSLGIENLPASLQTYVCQPITIRAKDGQNNNAPNLTQNLYFKLSPDMGFNSAEYANFYSDAACNTSPLTSHYIPAGSNFTSVYMMVIKNSNITLRAQSPQVFQMTPVSLATTSSSFSTMAPATAPAGISLSFVITGGSAPYSIAGSTNFTAPSISYVNGKYVISATAGSVGSASLNVTDANGTHPINFTISP